MFVRFNTLDGHTVVVRTADIRTMAPFFNNGTGPIPAATTKPVGTTLGFNPSGGIVVKGSPDEVLALIDRAEETERKVLRDAKAAEMDGTMSVLIDRVGEFRRVMDAADDRRREEFRRADPAGEPRREEFRRADPAGEPRREDEEPGPS